MLLTLIGISMLPAIQSGQVISVDTHYPFKDLHKGQIITFLSPYDPSGKTTHRIFEVHGDWVWTMGDNNSSPDRVRVTIKNYVGKVQ